MSDQINKCPADRHIPVLFEEVMDYLRPAPGGRYLDGTLGMGGHTEGIMMRSGGKAEVLGLDRDQQALELAGERLERFGERVRFAQSCFSEFEGPLRDLGWDSLDGALIDIGVSSLQLDNPERGFSFIQDGPLDMRMGHADGLAPASSIVNKASYERLKMIIGRYGEEPQGGRIARAIIEARLNKPIETTLELATLVEKAYPAKMRATARNHPATRTFQALRMEVNRELDELQEYLNRILPFLKPGGRLAVICFHSLEDRIVKHMFQRESKGCLCPREVPICQCGHVPLLKILTKKPVTAGPSELETNPRARSAKLRVAEKLPVSSPVGS
ncbi:MAG: 16S rRNA (cytosine(1402)-N(4))-methyltransferase RsmH [Proteobacteria bacterium]|nr:16S rRNA (cytosine(1402)-N(4))-methyltransferase RsmH [Pseudomonadota bacterium]